jgi:tetratricopeptide (TPR) repeat protein
MGRFSNLEFDGGKEPLREEPVAGEVRDETYYLKLADSEFRRARFDKALRYYSRALEYNANVVAAWTGQVQMLIELGEFKEARLWADKALEIHRDSADILSAKAIAVARQGDPGKAIEFTDAALAQRGATPYLWLARGEALLAARQSNEDHCLEKAASEAKQDWFMQLRIARVYYSYRRFAQAMDWISKAVKQEPGAPFALHVMGDCQLALGFDSSAQHSYQQALSIDRDFALSSIALDGLKTRGPLDQLWRLIRTVFSRR